ncbi:pilus assembly protein TadG-related protein [Mesorhizobium sp. M0155]
MMPVVVLLIIPLIAAVGLSVDYTSAVNTKDGMRNALDAGILAITTMPTNTSKGDREAMLQQSYKANGGLGTATLNNVTIDAFGSASFTASASYPMPTDFMSIANIKTVQIGVNSAVRKTPALVETTFKVSKVSGHWGKTMTLYGTKFGATTAKPMMTIEYAYNGFGDPKGYGTTIVKKITNAGGADIITTVQKQECKTATVKNFNNLPAGAITQTSGSTKYLTTCTNTMYPANSDGAIIDVSQINELYLEMNVPSGNPKILKSNDPLTSNRLYIGPSATDMPEVATGNKVDIFTSVPCGQTGYQAWEDGGNPVPAPVANADFFYTVQGKCDYNQRPSETVLTQ